MQDNKLTVEEVLSYFAAFKATGLFQITPQGPNDFFVHAQFPQDHAPDRFDPAQFYGVAETFVTDEFGAKVQRYGAPGSQLFARLSWHGHENCATITTVVTHRKRHSIANILLEALKSGTPKMIRAAVGKNALDADKAYQAPEILDVLHRINLVRRAEGSDSALSADLDENTVEFDNQMPIRPTNSPIE